MKTALIYSDNIRQVVLTPETESEKKALKEIKPDDSISLSVHHGNVYDRGINPFRANVNLCQGGYLRMYDDNESLILVLSPKEPEPEKSEQFTIEDMKECFEQSRLTHSLAGFKHDTFENYIYWKKTMDSAL